VVVGVSLGKFITIRVSEDLYNKLKELKITTTELRKVIEDYIRSKERGLGESPKDSSVSRDSSDSKISEILSKFESRALEYIEDIKKLCRDYANEVVAKDPQADRDLVYDLCRYQLRRHVYNTLRDFYKIKVEPLIREYVSEGEYHKVERRVHDIINKMIKELYPEPYPPMRLSF
jgi:predicted CopG family antitoxin